MPRPRRAGRTRRETITEAEALWAYDKLTPEHPDHYPTQYFTSKARFREVWDEMRDEVLEAWIAEKPGTRPQHWWMYDAPRSAPGSLPRCSQFEGELPELRRRVGGTGTPSHEVLNYAPDLDRGIPTGWVEPWQVELYNGRARDVRGQLIGTEYSEGHFPYEAIDRNDPPLFESEASYLDRHGLLTQQERARLGADAWEPESVEPHDDYYDTPQYVRQMRSRS